MNTEDRFYSNKDRNFYSKWLHSYEKKDKDSCESNYDSNVKDNHIKHDKKNKNKYRNIKRNHKHTKTSNESNNFTDESHWNIMHRKEYNISQDPHHEKPCCNKKKDICDCPWDVNDLCLDEFKINCKGNCKNQKQIRELFKFVIISIFAIDKNMSKIQKAFCILIKLVIRDECIGNRTKSTIRSIQNDLTSLEFVVKKTLKDLICLKNEIL